MDPRSTLPFLRNNASNQVNNEVVMDDMHQPVQQQAQQQSVPPLSSPPAITTAFRFPVGQPLRTNFSSSVITLMENQRQEMDHYLRLQNAQIRVALLQQRRQHMISLIRRLELNSSIQLREKEEELTRVRNRALASMQCLRRAWEEKEMWQRIATEKEATALALSRTLQQIREPCFSSTGATIEEDVASSSASIPRGGGPKPSEGAESRYACRSCGSHGSPMLLLPCRHLCACKQCVASINACPICNKIKIDSIEIFLA